MDRSHLTARARCKLSAPAQVLLEHGLLVGRILDFGAGKGDLARFLDGDIEAWDPHYSPKLPRGKFDVVCCLYVLNVLRPQARCAALAQAKEYVRPGGCLYVAVRRDPFEDGTTLRGAEQFHVQLDMESIFHKKGKFEIYVWRNDRKS